MDASLRETLYVQVGNHHIAYQVFGSGPSDILLVRPALNHLDAQWDEPRFARFMTRLASFARVITFDPAGVGMSDPITEEALHSDERWCEDQLAVMDAANCTTAALVIAGFAPFGLLLAATHPERIDAVVAVDNVACVVGDPEYPFYVPREVVEASATAAAQHWGSIDFALAAEVPQATREWLARYRRTVCTPGTAQVRYRLLPDIDVRDALGSITAPTLLLAHNESVPFGAGPSHFMSERIPNASVVELPGVSYWFWAFPDPDAVGDEIERFLTGGSHEAALDRVLLTVAFTDVVGSTTRAAEIGDRRWLETVADLQEMTKAETDRFKGQVIKWTGDGHLITFDSPGRALRWAEALRRSVGRIDVQLRIGLHTGEVEVLRDDIGGMAVNIARRVCDLGGADDVLVSGSLPSLVVGSGFEFAPRGSFELRGVPGEWQILSLK